MESEVADHCLTFSLSDPKNSCFQGKCNHNHDEVCYECNKLTGVLSTIKEACAELQSEEERDDSICLVAQAEKDILAWKAHQLRTVNQDQAKHDVLDVIFRSSALLVMDWAMKFLPRKFCESQCDWFAKRGIPWHITVAFTRSEANAPLEKLTFVHLFQSCPQDSVAVTAILQDVIEMLKERRPQLQKVYCKQDNAGCYHCGSTVVGSRLNSLSDVKVERFDFSDPQGGKGEADRQAATIKGHINVYLNEGHDVNNAAQMKEAIESNGGIPGVIVKYVKPPELSAGKNVVKWDGISTLNNFQFCPNGITTWKAYNIGPGKLVPWKDIQTDGIFPATLEVLEPPDTRSQQSSFRKINPRKEVQQKSLSEQRLSSPDQQETAGQDMDVEKEKEEVSGLFTCPEDGCIQTFQRSSSLQAHLAEGKHKRALEKETLFDKARKGYAARITGEQTKVPTFGFYAASKISVDKLHSTLEMGWALKTTRSRTHFTEEQRKFLTEQFLIGEECGKKADPQQVSQEMRRVRDEKAARIFSGKDILSPQQVAGFFSRLAARIRKTSATSNEQSGSEDEEQCAVEAEALHSHLREVVSEEIALRHPIVALSRNICSLVHTKKLSTLTVAVLRDICEDIGLNVDDITEKRKKPLISRITQVVKECSCARV